MSELPLKEIKEFELGDTGIFVEVEKVMTTFKTTNLVPMMQIKFKDRGNVLIGMDAESYSHIYSIFPQTNIK